MIKAAIFDMDGLLIDSEPLARIVLTNVFRPYGFAPSDADWSKTQGTGYKPAIAYYIHNYGQNTDLDVDEVTEQVLEEMKKVIHEKGKLMPGVEHALSVCQKAGLKVAIASSSPISLIETVVKAFNLENYFDLIYSGANEDFGKPHPGVFITTAQKLCVTPHECVVFEDSPSGVLAAKAARMHCVAVPEPEVKSHKYIQTADHVLDSLEDFDKSMLE